MNDLREIKATIEKLRVSYLCDVETDGFCPEAEQYFLLMLSALEQARIWAEMGALAQTRAIAERSR